MVSFRCHVAIRADCRLRAVIPEVDEVPHQRQALTLLMSIMDTCQVLLLDEPTAALDPRSAEVVMKTADNLIKDFDLTAILITHNLKDAYNYGTRIIQMGEGQILKDVDATHKQKLKQNDLFEWFG